MAPSEDPCTWRASLKDTSLGTDLETSSGGKLGRHQKAIPAAHLTFVIDCAEGKQLSLAAPPAPPQASSPNRGLIVSPMKTYIVFCGDKQPHLTQETTLGGGQLVQGKNALPPCREAVTSASLPGSPLCSQEAPEAKGKPSKAAPVKSTWGTVKGSLKALSSCVCGQAD
ncbi:steroid receptor-associated and regulated protein [Tupaia chinensis]|uniref:Steroid receptor-associated and regulated protein n=1 Tax=Tupaia chinensis TaxID=246437 RepID=L9L071_TUPCH|nr:steroid receptor-associated and regulated protein [Tupaia chinensis]ELW68595.1 hypothetical protein TREES_T100008753 [Tupaia chinensis]